MHQILDVVKMLYKCLHIKNIDLSVFEEYTQAFEELDLCICLTEDEKYLCYLLTQINLTSVLLPWHMPSLLIHLPVACDQDKSPSDLRLASQWHC